MNAGELTTEKVNTSIAIIFEVLGEPETDLHREALKAFQDGNYQAVKRMSLANLDDFYCKDLGYLGGALKLTCNEGFLWTITNMKVGRRMIVLVHGDDDAKEAANFWH